MKLVILATLAATIAVARPALALSPPSFPPTKYVRSTSQLETESQTRGDFLFTATAAAITGAAIASPIQPVYARGRATLDQSYDRYTPRIIDGGAFYKKELYGAISKGDWKAIETALQEPPPKSKADRALQDGGVAKRAAQAGGFSDSRVLVAMDLFASTFSESSISPKTKAMKAQVEILRKVVQGMYTSARIATGEEKVGGGLFGMGGKAPSQEELVKEVKDLYLKGGNAYNQYVFDANEGLPVQLAKIPYL